MGRRHAHTHPRTSQRPCWRLAGVALACALASGCSAQKARQQDAPTQQRAQDDWADAPASERITTEATTRRARRARRDRSQSEQPAPPPAEPNPLGEGLGARGPAVLIGSPPPAQPLRLPAADPAPPPRRRLLVAASTPYQLLAARGTYVHVAAWRHDGAPAARAQVFLDQKHVGVTDMNGALAFKLPPRAPGAPSTPPAAVITVAAAEDQGVQGRVAFQPHARTEGFVSDQLFVHTDRGVYRPGEQVRVRVIGWRLGDQYRALVDQALEIRLKDARGRVITGGVARTDAFGVAALDLPLTRTLSEGPITLEARSGQARAEAPLHVRHLQQPAIIIEHGLGDHIPRKPAQLAVDMRLRSPFGEPIEGVDLSAEVAIDGRVVARMSRKARGEGAHTLRVQEDGLRALRDAIARAGGTPRATITMTARAPHGRTAHAIADLAVTDHPYTGALELDREHYHTHDPVRITARLHDHRGAPAARVPVTVRCGEGGVVAGLTDGRGEAQITCKMPDMASVITLQARGHADPLARTTARWVTTSPMRAHLPSAPLREREHVRVRVTFPAHIVPVERVVHMDMVDASGALVHSALLPVREQGGVFQAEGKIQAPVWGTALVTLFVLGRSRRDVASPSAPHHTLGLITEGQSLIVRPDRELRITLDGVPDVAAPGQPLTIRARVQDRHGQPAQVSVGAALVDQRALAAHDPLRLGPAQVFYDPSRRAMTTTSARLLSWPVLSRNWGSARQDLTLPPFRFQPGGALVASAGGELAFKARGEGQEVAPDKTEREAKPTVDKAPRSPRRKRDTSANKINKPDKKPAEAAPNDDAVATLGDLGRQGADRERLDNRDVREPRTPPLKITIRTRFDTTSLWAPRVEGSGQVVIPARLPDTIAPQELVLIASDDEGGVGMLRKTVQVTQPLHARVDMPAQLTAGEEVRAAVTIRCAESCGAMVLRAEAPGLGVKAQEVPLQLDAGEARTVSLVLRPERAGRADYVVTLRATSSGRTDVTRGVVQVLPAGVPHDTVTRGVATSGAPFAASWTAAPGQLASAHITLPGLTAALQGLDALERRVSDDPMSLAGDLTAAALVLQHARARKLSSPKLTALRARVLGSVGALTSAQRPDGAFVYWRTGNPSVMMTAWVLEGLLEAQELDLPVDQRAITRAASWLAARFGTPGGLLDMREVEAWEGDRDRMREGLTAQVVHVLARVPEATRTRAVQAVLTAQLQRGARLLQREALDPLVAGLTVETLLRHKRLPAPLARRVIDRLRQRRDAGRWEPSWFHAFGGKVEATSAMIHAMLATDPKGYQADLRDAADYLLATRESMGAWHNERATSAALRALLRLHPTRPTTGTITVKLDGRTVRRVQLDRDTPFAAALALASVELPLNTRDAHRLQVEATGGLRPSVTLRRRDYAPFDARQRRASSTLVASAPSTVKAGNATSLTISLKRAATAHTATLTLPLDRALLTPDLPALARHVEADPHILRYTLDAQGLHLELRPDTRALSIPIPLRARRAGKGAWPTVLLHDGATVRTASPGALSIS